MLPVSDETLPKLATIDRREQMPSSTQVSRVPTNGIKILSIVVIGHYGSGLTQFIQSISEIGMVSSESSIGSDKDYRSIPLDFGRITIDDELVLFLFVGARGSRRFDFIWEIPAEGMLGFILLVDSTKPETFRESKSILETCRAYIPLPHVIAANFQDHPLAWNTDDLRTALREDRDVKILPCIATDPESVKNIFLELMYSILEALSKD